MKFSTFLVALLLPVTAFAGCVNFPRDLKQGMSGDDIYAMQKILNSDSATIIASSGDGAPGHESDYFGVNTFLALQAFQKLYATDVLTTGASSTPSGIATEATRAKLSKLSCEIDVSRPVAPTSTPSQLGSGLCAAIPLAPAPRPKVRLENPVTYQVRRGDVVAFYGANFTENNTVDIGNKSVCSLSSADGGGRIDVTIPLDAGLGVQYVRVTNKYGVSNLIKIFVLEASPHETWSGGCVNLSRVLSLKSKGADVKTLQRFLNSDTRTQIAAEGVESYGKETDLFSALTKNGVFAFQKLYAADVLRPAGLLKPTGVIGQLSAKKIRALTNCGSLDTAPTPTQVVGAPGLLGIRPSRGADGDDIVLSGTNFTGANTILFGGKAFGPYGSADGKSIVFTLTSLIPPGTWPVVIRTSNGTSKPVDFTMLATSTIGKLPHINYVTPSHGKPGVVVTLTGVGFTPTDNTIADIGNSGFVRSGITSADLGRTIKLTIPTSIKSGVINMQLTNANGKSNARAFVVDAEPIIPPPQITTINPPAAKQGANVTLVGQNFIEGSAVFIDGTAFTDFHIGGQTNISLALPISMSVGAHEVYVQNGKGKSNVKTLTVIDKNADVPHIDSITPSTAKVGDSVLIKGRSLTGINLVYFGSTLGSSISGNTTGTEASLFVRNLDPGVYQVHIQNSGGISNEVPLTIYKDERPSLTSLYPTSAYPDDPLKLHGKNLLGGTVIIDSKTISAQDDGSYGVALTSTVPSDIAAGTYKVHVHTAKGDSNELTLIVQPAKPVKLTVVSPNIVPPQMPISLVGQSLGDSVDVHIGDTVIAGVPVNGGVMLGVTLPSAVVEGSYQVWVTTAKGDTNKLTLTVSTGAGGGGGGGGGTGGAGVHPPPMIYSLNPSEVDRAKCLASGGIRFTINGENFTTSSDNLIKSSLGGELHQVSGDGRTLYFKAGSYTDAIPCVKPSLDPTNDLDVYVFIQNTYGTSDMKKFKVKGLPSVPGF